MDIGEVRKNSKVLVDGVPYNIEDVDFVKPGKGRAIYRLKMRNLTDGSLMEKTYHSGDRMDEVNISTYEMQYLYKEGDHYVFMDTRSFEQTFINEDLVGEKIKYLKEGMTVTIMMMGDRPLDVALPTFVELKVVSTEASTKKFTIDAQSKSATLETGYTIDVPVFVKEGDVLKIDTRTGTYVERITRG